MSAGPRLPSSKRTTPRTPTFSTTARSGPSCTRSTAPASSADLIVRRGYRQAETVDLHRSEVHMGADVDGELAAALHREPGEQRHADGQARFRVDVESRQHLLQEPVAVAAAEHQADGLQLRFEAQVERARRVLREPRDALALDGEPRSAGGSQEHDFLCALRPLADANSRAERAFQGQQRIDGERRAHDEADAADVGGGLEGELPAIAHAEVEGRRSPSGRGAARGPSSSHPARRRART